MTTSPRARRTIATNLIELVPPALHRGLLRLLQPVRLRIWGLLRREVEGIMVLGFTDDGRILLVRHSYHLADQWLVPGGGRHRGEDALTTARREIVEETGCALEDATCFATVRRSMREGWVNRIDLVTGTVIGLPRADGREIVEVGLFPLDALPPTTSDMTREHIVRWRLWRDTASKG